MTSAVRYGIGDLARLGGVTRRTVRYYVQEGLIPPPLGVGRGNHYGALHLEQLLRVKTMQEAGRTLEEIRREGVRGDKRRTAFTIAPERAPLERSLWRRLTLAPGVELHVAGSLRLPSPGKLYELSQWCRMHFGPDFEQEGEKDNV